MKYPTLMLCIQRGFPASPAVASLYNNNLVLHSVHRQTPASRRLNSLKTLGYCVYCWSVLLECQHTLLSYHKPCPCSHPDADLRYSAGLPARLVNFKSPSKIYPVWETFPVFLPLTKLVSGLWRY